MFFSSQVFVTKGKLAPVWLAANWNKKLTKKEVSEISVNDSVTLILSPAQPIALRMSGNLLKGVVRLWQRQTGYLHEDCNEALRKIQRVSLRKKRKQKGVTLADDNTGDAELITISDSFVKDIFSDMPTDYMQMMSVEDMQNFMDQGQSFLNEGLNEQRNQGSFDDIRMLEDHTVSFDLSGDSSDAVSLLDDNDDLLEIDNDNQSEGGYSYLLEALQENSNTNSNTSVEKGQNLSIDIDDLSNSNIDRLSDYEDIMTDLSDQEIDLDKENLSMGSMSLINEAKKDLSLDLSDRSLKLLGPNNSSLNLNSSSDLNLDSILMEDQGPVSILPEPVANKKQSKKARRRKRRRKPIKDKVTELTNEIIKKQLRDTSDIMFEKRPYADLRPRTETVFCNQDYTSLLIKPILSGYASELKTLYETCFIPRKRQRLNAEAIVEEHRKELHQSDLLNSMSLELNSDHEPFGVSGGKSLSLSSIGLNQGSLSLDKSSSLDLASVSDNLLSDHENHMGDISLIAEPKSMSSTENMSNRTSKASFLGEFGESIEIEDETIDKNAGWSTRTQKMLQYLGKKDERDFVFQDMVSGKPRLLVAGFFYELLVLKTHGMIDLNQEDKYGKIQFSKTDKMMIVG